MVYSPLPLDPVPVHEGHVTLSRFLPTCQQRVTDFYLPSTTQLQLSFETHSRYANELQLIPNQLVGELDSHLPRPPQWPPLPLMPSTAQ